MIDDVQRLMKRCQIGIGGRDARACLDDANDLLAECYGALGRQHAENEKLRGALRDIIRHQTYTGGEMALRGAICTIASKALETAGEGEG